MANPCPICENANENNENSCPSCGYDLEEDLWANRKQREDMRQEAKERFIQSKTQKIDSREELSQQAKDSCINKPDQFDNTIKAAPNTYLMEQNETYRYRILSNGTIVDIETGLQWMRCALGQRWNDGTCTGNANFFTFDQAINAVNFLNKGSHAGHQDWRLPTLDELKTIIVSANRPSINQDIFPKTPNNYFWSSLIGSDYPDSLWVVNFIYGYSDCYFKEFESHVRLVRGSYFIP